MKTNNRGLIWWMVIAGLTGISLRVASFSWNTALNGDVNLFALTAREFAMHGQLDYPMKYEFSDRVEYLTLHTPASQHPPLWHLFAGLISRVIATDDTFLVLKVLSEISGLCIIVIVALIGNKFLTNPASSLAPPGTEINLIAICLVSLSAILIDFSANGSPYSLMALWLLLGSWLLLRIEPKKFSHLCYAGILCVVSILTHSALSLLPLAFIFAILRHRSPQAENSRFPIIASPVMQIFVFLTVVLLGLSPWLYWNMQNFGVLFHSYSSNYLVDQLGCLHTGLYGDVITSRLEYNLSGMQILQRYALLASKSLYALCRELVLLVGPFGLILFGVGLAHGMKKNKMQTFALLLPFVMYIAVIIVWATYKFRFLTPIIPIFSLLAAGGFMALFKRGMGWRWIANLCLAGTIAWFLFPVFQTSKTMYYGQESSAHDALYEKMQPLASSLANRDRGVVLGYSQYLDGGIETVYWHRFPFVAGRGMGEAEIKKLAADFDIRYIWADNTTRGLLQQWFPSAKMINHSGEFVILEFPD